MTAIIEWDGVVKEFGADAVRRRALDGVSLSVQPGEFVAVMGPSGSGKSTLLHLGGGLEVPTVGSVLLAGTDLSTMSTTKLARLRRTTVGYIFQRLNLVAALTAIENVMLPLELDGTPTRDARRQADAALDRVGFTPPRDAFPDDLSGGEQQRIAIARSIIGKRELVLADEPTGALDTLAADAIVSLLSSLTEDGVSVVLVTHEPRLASFAGRIVFLRDGRVVDESVPTPVAGARR